MKYVLITGVSTGIGKGIAKELVKSGYFVFGTVRKKQDAQRLTEEMQSERFLPVLADVTDSKTVEAAFKTVKKKLGGRPLYGLINNAGILTGGPLVALNLDHYRQVMEVNFFGIVKMMQIFIPLMSGYETDGKGGQGKKNKEACRIINISSVLGHYGLPYISTYTASKFAVEGFSDSVRRELEMMNIKLVVLIPGAVKTEIFKKGAKEEDYDYAKGTVFEHHGRNLRKELLKREEQGITCETVGRYSVKILKAKNPRPRYHISGSPFLEWYWPKYLPDRFLDFILRWLLR